MIRWWPKRQARNAPEYRIQFLGDRNPDTLTQTKTQPPMSGISSYNIHPSGGWITAVDSETGQTTITRILPTTTMILVDRQQPWTVAVAIHP